MPPSIWSSDNSLASDSTIITAESLPAMTISKSDPSNSLRVGLMQYCPSINPTLAAPSGPLNGRPDIATAAEAAMKDRTSGSTSLSDDITVQITCTS